MVHKGYTELGILTWELDPRAIPLAQQIYDREGDKALGPYASTHYSFRDFKTTALRDLAISRLLAVRGKVADRLKDCVAHPVESTSSDFQGWVNTVDTFSTHVEWISHRPELTDVEHMLFADLAEHAVSVGIQQAQNEPMGDHNLPLLRLTAATILLKRGNRTGARRQLQLAFSRAPFAQDMNQKKRIYRKTAYLALQARMPLLAVRAGVPWLMMK